MRLGIRRVGVLSAMSAMLLAVFVSEPATAAVVAPFAAQAGVSMSGASSHPALSRGARATRTVRFINGQVVRMAVPQAPAQPASRSGRVLANFDGVSSLDSGITNFGAEFQPPDQGLCAGNGFVLEMVNSAFRVYDAHGTTLKGPMNVNDPFRDGYAQFTSDPRCQYDAATNTWFAIILFINNPGTKSRLDIAYNTTGDPRKTWSQFRIDTTHSQAPASFGCPCFGDQPTLGIDAYNIYTTTNEFSILGPQADGGNIYAISKSDLVSHSTNVHFVQYPTLHIAGAMATSIQPAITNGSAQAEYFLSSLDPNGTGDNRIGVWALTNVSRVSTGGRPTLSDLVIASEGYGVPVAARQMGSATPIDSGDDRMQQTQFINGEIWGELDTVVQPAGDPLPRAGAAWFRVQPQLTGSMLTSAVISAQGYVASAGNYVLYPALEADSSGNAAMVFTLTGAHRFASSAYALMSSGGTGFGQPVVSAPGTGQYDPDGTRWGDYSWAVLDTTADAVWMATEYIPPPSSQTADGNNNWGTRVVEVSLLP